MCLINAYSRELQDMRNDACFRERISLLEENDMEQYNKIISDMNHYNTKIDDDILMEVKTLLDLTDEIIQNSHDTYQKRENLYEIIDTKYN
jgi:hypothetical protein